MTAHDPTFTRRRLLARAGVATLAIGGLPLESAARATLYEERSMRPRPRHLDPARTMHIVGDTHFGAVAEERMAAVLRDVNALNFAPSLHLHVGDVTDVGRPQQDLLALQWLDGLAGPWIAACGNHDIWDNGRSADDFARAFGNSSANFVRDLGYATLIVLSYERLRPGDNGTMWLSRDQVRWLDETLTAARKTCIIVSHATLYGTVGGDEMLLYTSRTPGFYIRSDGREPDALLREVLARRPQARLWVSGHTHSPFSAPGIIAKIELGTRRMMSLNASALFYTGRRITRTDALSSLFVTCWSDRIDIRRRDHATGTWAPLAEQPVVSIPLADLDAAADDGRFRRAGPLAKREGIVVKADRGHTLGALEWELPG
ncbi:MAG: metallophosphoesterase [Gemmatimonadaceae bacterium]